MKGINNKIKILCKNNCFQTLLLSWIVDYCGVVSERSSDFPQCSSLYGRRFESKPRLIIRTDVRRKEGKEFGINMKKVIYKNRMADSIFVYYKFNYLNYYLNH